MLPYYLEIAGFKLPSYGLMIALGSVTGTYLMMKNIGYRLKKLYPDTDLSKIKTTLPKPETMMDFILIAIICGLVGGKLLYVLPNIGTVLKGDLFEALTNGFVVYGAIIGGAAGGLLYCRLKGLNTLAYFDAAVPFLALAQAFGRVGCFLAGCCYGIPTTSPVGVTFTSEFSLAPTGVSLVPTQLFSSAGNLLIFLTLLYIGRNAKKIGTVFASYLILYSVGRFVIELYRGDIERGFINGLSTSQFISIFVFIAGAGLMVLIFKSKNNGYEELADK